MGWLVEDAAAEKYIQTGVIGKRAGEVPGRHAIGAYSRRVM